MTAVVSVSPDCLAFPCDRIPTALESHFMQWANAKLNVGGERRNQPSYAVQLADSDVLQIS